MEKSNSLVQEGALDARYKAFLETVTHLRPQLHRYCARMTGSVMDGEDVVQESLFEAYRKLDKFDESRPLRPWLFRIAHNRCIDFLRRRGVRDEAERILAVPDAILPTVPAAFGIDRALEYLIVTLPPKERACVLLKDVFDYSLEEIAEMVDSTPGGVKAALSRARTKLATPSPQRGTIRSVDPELRQLLQLYVERFNRRDWEAVRELTSADAQIQVVDAFAGKLVDSPYFSNYARWTVSWKLAVAEADGEIIAAVLHGTVNAWTPYSFVRFKVADGKIDRIVDYSHCPWIASLADSAITGNAN